MYSPSPGIWPGLIDERRRRLGAFATPRRTADRGVRVFLGRALIAAGSALSGERVDTAPRPPALPRSA